MARSDALHPFQRWGTIDVAELGKVARPRASGVEPLMVKQSSYTWQPARNLDMPGGFQLVLDCEAGSDDVRRWTPSQDPYAFVLQASLAGQTILERAGVLSKAQSRSYNNMRLFFELSNRRREYFGRRFRRREDLMVIKAARIERERNDILPDDLGLTQTGKGKRWSVSDLLTHGRQAAIEAGLSARDEELWVRHGLLEAARMNPFDPAKLATAQLRSVIRLGLFDFDAETHSVDKEIAVRIVERFLTALERYLDDPPDKFRKRFFKQADNLVHQVAKKKHPGGPIDRSAVRSVLLQFVFDAHEYIADCLLVAMRAFAAALPQPLTESEIHLFSLLYLKPPTLGGIPLIMLHDRLPTLRECAIDLFYQPGDSRVVGTFLRVLNYYAAMTRNRREADRRRERRTHHRNDVGRPALSYELDEEVVIAGSDDQQHEVIAALLENRKAVCQCATTDNWKVITEPAIGEGVFDIEFGCSECGHTESIRTSQHELKDLASALRHRDEGFTSPG